MIDTINNATFSELCYTQTVTVHRETIYYNPPPTPVTLETSALLSSGLGDAGLSELLALYSDIGIVALYSIYVIIERRELKKRRRREEEAHRTQAKATLKTSAPKTRARINPLERDAKRPTRRGGDTKTHATAPHTHTDKRKSSKAALQSGGKLSRKTRAAAHKHTQSMA